MELIALCFSLCLDYYDNRVWLYVSFMWYVLSIFSVDDMLAFGKPTSLLPKDGAHYAHLAVDGDLETHASTANNYETCWIVHLGEDYIIREVLVYVVKAGQGTRKFIMSSISS